MNAPDQYENAPDARPGVEGDETDTPPIGEPDLMLDHTASSPALTPPSWWRSGDEVTAANSHVGAPVIDWIREIPCDVHGVSVSLVATDSFDDGTFVRSVDAVAFHYEDLRQVGLSPAEVDRLITALDTAARTFAGDAR